MIHTYERNYVYHIALGHDYDTWEQLGSVYHQKRYITLVASVTYYSLYGNYKANHKLAVAAASVESEVDIVPESWKEYFDRSQEKKSGTRPCSLLVHF